MPYIDPDIIDQVEKGCAIFREANAEVLKIWLSNIVFSWQWWVLLGLAVLPWIIWLAVRSRQDTYRLLYAGVVIVMVTCLIDLVGSCAGLWYYLYPLIPHLTPYFPWDFTLLPVSAMLVYQLFPAVHPLIKAAVYSAAGAFAVQPLFTWLGFISFKTWNVFYSFPLLFGIYMLGYYFFSRGGKKVGLR